MRGAEHPRWNPDSPWHGNPKTLAEGRPSRSKYGREPQRPWTGEEIEFLRRRAGGASWETVAGELGRSRMAVVTKAHKLGIAGRPRGWHTFTEEQREEVLQQRFATLDARGRRSRGGPRRRLEALERDEFTCLECGLASPSGDLLIVHHIVPFDLTRDVRLENLVTLCYPDHQRQRAHAWTEFRPEFIEELPGYQQEIWQA